MKKINWQLIKPNNRIEKRTRKMEPLMGISGAALLKEVVKKVVSTAYSKLKDGYSEWQLRKRANDGEDFTRDGLFKELVRKELQKIAAKPKLLPEGLRDANVSTWLLKEEFLEPFIWVLIASGDGRAQDGGLAYSFLAQQYASETGESKNLATGPIKLISSHILGLLRLDAKRKAEFQLALDRLQAAGFQAYFRPELRATPTAFDIFRLQNLARNLIDAGRSTWGMPEFVAPFSLEAQEIEKKKEPVPVSAAEIVSEIQPKTQIVLSGEGGIGKTTFLLQLASLCITSNKACIPIFVDAATWAASNSPILDFVGTLSPARIQNLSANDLTWFAKGAHIVLMVNGWNEIPADQKSNCQSHLNSLITAAADMPVVIVSRTTKDAGNLSHARSIAVRGITSYGQHEIIRAELSIKSADTLLQKLELDIQLQQAARSPLILRGLIAQAKKGLTTSASVYDLLEAVVNELEEHSARQPILAAPPLSGLQRYYLEDLACELNKKRTVRLTNEEAYSALAIATQRVAHMLGAPVSLPEVLNVLRNYHVIHIQDDGVQFAHQRFQEYFSASRLKRICEVEGESAELLNYAINEPYWDDAIGLVAEKFKLSNDTGKHKLKLIEAALTLDLPYACDLAGRCSITSADSPTLCQLLISKINQMSSSSLSEVQDLAVACKIASCFPEFANDLWALFENGDRHNRLQSYRVNGTPVSISQLGVDAIERISSWKVERQSEFMHEISDNLDNYNFLLNSARLSPELSVRHEALHALLWSYPTSTAVLNAWLEAPNEIQAEYTIISFIKYALEQGMQVPGVREQLRLLAISDIPANDRLNLALSFPDEIEEIPLDTVFGKLATEDVFHVDDDPLLELARRHAPERLNTLAIELSLSEKLTPRWVSRVLSALPSAEREAVFDQAWKLVSDVNKKVNLRPADIGPLACKTQISECMSAWLEYRSLPHTGRTIESEGRQRTTEDLLAHVAGDGLFDIVIEEGVIADYEKSDDLITLLWNRIEKTDGQFVKTNRWKPTPDQIQKLLRTFGDKTETSTSLQVRVPILLASMASEVAAGANAEALLSALDRYLNAWSLYQTLVDEWVKQPKSLRPTNPMYGQYLVAALANWSFDGLPRILERVNHPSAYNIIPVTLSRITNQLWFAETAGSNWSVASDVNEGIRRRTLGLPLRQPTSEHQGMTDSVADFLSSLLDAELVKVSHEKEKNPLWNPLKTGQVPHYARVLAQIPSQNCVTQTTRALRSGLLGTWNFIEVLRGLLHQGWSFSDASVIRELEALYQKESQENSWNSDGKQALAQLCQLALSVESLDLLSQPLEYYLREWRRHSHPAEMIRLVSDAKTSYAWTLLLKIQELFGSDGFNAEELGRVLGPTFRLEYIDSLIALIDSGQLFSWCKAKHSRESIAHHIARIVKNHPSELAKIMDALCRIGSDAADGMGYEILMGLGAPEQIIVEFGLAIADAGRADSPHRPAYHALMSLFTLKRPLSENQYEIHPKACNLLKKELFERTSGTGPVSLGARRMLALLECNRREGGRPTDEPRHPIPCKGKTWTDTLILVDV